MSITCGRQPDKNTPEFEPMAKTLERFTENITTRTGVPEHRTGLWVLDDGIYGLHSSQLTILAARPGVGKTSLACQIALNLAAQGKRVAFLSLEMTKESVLERMFCISKNIDASTLMRSKLSEETQKKLSQFIADIQDYKLRIIDDYCYTENQLYTLIDHLEFRPEILVLDHIQHIQCGKGQSKFEAITEYFRFLKEVSLRHKIAVLCLSQVNRQGEEAPTIANLKGCGALEEMADHVLLMHDLKEPTAMENNFKIQVAKNRFGKSFVSYELFFAKEFSKFFDSYDQYKIELGR
jgi:replicative DNA helicase